MKRIITLSISLLLAMTAARGQDKYFGTQWWMQRNKDRPNYATGYSPPVNADKEFTALARRSFRAGIHAPDQGRAEAAMPAFDPELKVERHDDGTVTATWGDGCSYTGQIYYGEISGRGTMSYPDGSRYEGEWAADLPNGKGTFTDAAGVRFTSRWIDGVPHGRGSIAGPDGSAYTARWRHGKLRPESVKPLVR